MFGAILTAGYTALLVYAIWRARSVPLLARHLSRRRFFALGGALWLVFLLARTVGHGGTGFVASTLDGAGMILRVWELAGKSSSVTVRLPEATGLARRDGPRSCRQM